MVDMRAGSAVAQTIPSHTYSAFGAGETPQAPRWCSHWVMGRLVRDHL